jgi:hypothetical protein
LEIGDGRGWGQKLTVRPRCAGGVAGVDCQLPRGAEECVVSAVEKVGEP